MKANGWAMIKEGRIDIRTISPTQRGCMTLWLVHDLKWNVLATHSDEYVQGVFYQNRGDDTITVKMVTIEAKDD